MNIMHLWRKMRLRVGIEKIIKALCHVSTVIELWAWSNRLRKVNAYQISCFHFQVQVQVQRTAANQFWSIADESLRPKIFGKNISLVWPELRNILGEKSYQKYFEKYILNYFLRPAIKKDYFFWYLEFWSATGWQIESIFFAVDRWYK